MIAAIFTTALLWVTLPVLVFLILLTLLMPRVMRFALGTLAIVLLMVWGLGKAVTELPTSQQAKATEVDEALHFYIRREFEAQRLQCANLSSLSLGKDVNGEHFRVWCDRDPMASNGWHFTIHPGGARVTITSWVDF